MIYLDNAASTQIHDDVFESMIPYMREQYGNPSSIHRRGRYARKAVELARKQIASLVNANSSEILLTSGGTESNNMALFGATINSPHSHIITSSIEHDAILEPCRILEDAGFDVTYLPVDRFGTVDISKLESSISEKTKLVSIMYANNEVGTIEPIFEIAKICREKNILFHSDAVQAVGKISLDVKKIPIDMLSISSHKLNGPKGVGALYIRKGTLLSPVIYGGGQERGLRSGTENVAGIVGFGKACDIARETIHHNLQNMKNLRDYMVTKITSEIPHTSLNGHPENRLPNNAHMTFLGVNGEDLIIKLDEYDIHASTGSACSVHTQKASHVLKSMGFSHEQITGSLRLTLGIFNDMKQVDEVVCVLKKVVAELRAVSPFREKYSFAENA
ncbi:MAG: cysteine desulfurase family protein [Thaumarchaeota archaeon]|nr:cysteine desulfurase family protein [Nitrososphaerota archaeon]